MDLLLFITIIWHIIKNFHDTFVKNSLTLPLKIKFSSFWNWKISLSILWEMVHFVRIWKSAYRRKWNQLGSESALGHALKGNGRKGWHFRMGLSNIFRWNCGSESCRFHLEQGSIHYFVHSAAGIFAYLKKFVSFGYLRCCFCCFGIFDKCKCFCLKLLLTIL